jgi:phenylalanyl-tRNA synthetase beta chain
MLGIETEVTERELKLEIPHNRPDLLSVEGVARTLKGFLGLKTGLPSYELAKPRVMVEIDPSTKDVRPYLACGVVRDVELSDEVIASLMQMQEKLHASLCRNRRKASIGVYDLDTIRPPIKYKTVAPDSLRFIPLDSDRPLTPAEILREHPKGIEYSHLLQNLVRYPILIDSKETVLALPPIVNSEPTKVTEGTRNLFVDVTGLDERIVHSALEIFMTAMGERGFRLESVALRRAGKRFITPQLAPQERSLDAEQVNKTIGLNLTQTQIARLAKRMRYGVKRIRGKIITLLIPPYRSDIMHEIDLIEDIAIAYGYDRLGPTLPPVSTTGEQAAIEKLSSKVRMIMVGLGFTEVMLYTLTSRRKLAQFGEEGLVEIANPVSEEYSVVRNSLLPSMLETAAQNRHNPTPQRFFEIGDVTTLDEKHEAGARTIRRVAGAIVGKGATFSNIKGVAEAVLRELGTRYEVRPLSLRGFIEGRAAAFVQEDKEIGRVGEVHPEALLAFGLENPVALFELELGSI